MGHLDLSTDQLEEVAIAAADGPRPVNDGGFGVSKVEAARKLISHRDNTDPQKVIDSFFHEIWLDGLFARAADEGCEQSINVYNLRMNVRHHIWMFQRGNS